METHTKNERMNGICKVCTMEIKDVKKCYGYTLIGDRSCDTRHIPGYQDGMSFIQCKHHINNLK